MGANIEACNIYGANVVHIAAQGDQPTPLYYFVKLRNMDLNAIDKRGSTPLHWACYSKSEFALCYILAMGPDLEIQDLSGLTPLHLAIKTVGELQSTRPVRSLLLKGANRNAMNYQGQSCMDMIKDDVEQSLKRELVSILKKPVYQECFLIGRVPLVPLKQNHKT